MKNETTERIIVTIPNALPAPAIPDFEPRFLAALLNMTATIPIISSIMAKTIVKPKKKPNPYVYSYEYAKNCCIIILCMIYYNRD